MTIRRAVGWLGIALPVVLYFGALLIGQCGTLKASISDYFYTKMLKHVENHDLP